MRIIAALGLALMLLSNIAGACSSPAHAQNPRDFSVFSANAMMPGCVAFLENVDSFSAGYCAGVVRALLATSFAFKACPPNEGSLGQSVRVVVAFINQNPARMHEPFEALVIDALRGAWPCKN